MHDGGRPIREDLPVQGYVTKPVDINCLVTVVKSLDGLGLRILRAE
jgi:hypothetical protein